jgi:hypothetical protein
VKKQNDCSSLGGIKPQTNLAFIPHQIKDYGVGIPVELANIGDRTGNTNAPNNQPPDTLVLVPMRSPYSH